MADNLTSQVREIARVTKCVAEGVLTEFITVDVKGEILDLKMTVNNMVRQLKTLSDEIIRVSVEVGTEGRLGGQANVDDVKGQLAVEKGESPGGSHRFHSLSLLPPGLDRKSQHDG